MRKDTFWLCFTIAFSTFILAWIYVYATYGFFVGENEIFPLILLFAYLLLLIALNFKKKP